MERYKSLYKNSLITPRDNKKINSELRKKERSNNRLESFQQTRHFSLSPISSNHGSATSTPNQSTKKLLPDFATSPESIQEAISELHASFKELKNIFEPKEEQIEKKILVPHNANTSVDKIKRRQDYIKKFLNFKESKKAGNNVQRKEKPFVVAPSNGICKMPSYEKPKSTLFRFGVCFYLKF